MSCRNCLLSKELPRGCKNNGSCMSGCNKKEVFNWLSDIPMRVNQNNACEVRFKDDRKKYYNHKIFLQKGDVVLTEEDSGYDIGIVTMTGDLVKLQLKKRNIIDVKKIKRKANKEHLSIWEKSIKKENNILKKSREIAKKKGFKIKITSVEMRADGKKVTVFYLSEKRIDFRGLLRDYIKEFKLKIQMYQIGSRQEAAKTGGIGVCGRELCCSTWINDFRSVNFKAPRYQQLSINPAKLAGQCGKLKCCLNYELEGYVEELKGFPDKNIILQTKNDKYTCIKLDVFKKQLWYKSKQHEAVLISLKRAKYIINQNANNKHPKTLIK